MNIRPLVSLVLVFGVAAPLGAVSQDELNTALQTAVNGDDLPAIKAALKAGADVNAPDPNGSPPLHGTMESNRIDIVETMLAAGAKVDARNSDQATALHLAVTWGWDNIARLLLARHADAKARDKNGETPLFRLGSKAQAIGEMLLSAGLDANAPDNAGDTALHVAASEGRLDAITFLLGHHADLARRNAKGQTPVDLAIASAKPDAVALLVAANGGKAAVTAIDALGPDGRTRLHHAAFEGDMKLATCLIAAGASVDAREIEGATPLFFAVASGHDQMVTFLLDHGADVNATLKAGRTALDLAIAGRNDAARKALETRGGKEGQSLVIATLSDALKANDAAKVGQLLDAYPALVQANDLLTTAAGSCSPAVVEMLLAKGCAIDRVNANGWTALHSAALNNRLENVRVLLAHKANPNVEEPKNKYTALDMAILFKYSDIDATLRAAGGTGKLDASKLLKELDSDAQAAAAQGTRPPRERSRKPSAPGARP